jgi:hypothetical protein
MGDHEFAEDGEWERHTMFRYESRDVAGAGGQFQLSEVKTDTPTRALTTIRKPLKLKQGHLRRVHYRMNAANAATFILRLYMHSVADDILSEVYLVWESPPAQARNTEYDEEADIPFELLAPGIYWYALEWSAAPGVTPGYVAISGDVKH